MERRLTTILAADIAGFSRLIGLDEEGTLEAQRSHRNEFIEPLLEKHGGRVANTAGDSLLIEYPSAVEAVRCALALQAGMVERNAEIPEDRRIVYRIGINVGDVVNQAGDLLGDGVNVAARLEALAPPGGIILSRSVRDQVRDRLELDLSDLGEISVKNITRPVRAFQVLKEGEAAIRPPIKSTYHSPRFTAVLIALLIIVGGLLAWLQPWNPDVERAELGKMAYMLPDRPSVAVLPFDNMSTNKEQEYFADGITEDIITDLSKISGLFIAARDSTFAYKGTPVKVRKVAEDLGVRYVLEGSVRRSADTIRITAQLIDTVKGDHLWAERYDRGLNDIFAVQSEVAQHVAKALDVTINSDEHERLFRKHIQSIEVYDAFIRARRSNVVPSKANVERAEKLFERVIELDPDFAGGYAGLSWNYSIKSRFQHGTSPESDAQRGLELANKAVDVDPLFGWTHIALGGAYLTNGDPDAAVNAVRQALVIQPNDFDANLFMGFYLKFAGQSALAVKHLELAKRMSPVGSARTSGFLGQAYFMNGDYNESVASWKDRLNAGAPNANVYIYLAAAYVMLEKPDEAAEAANKLRKIAPSFNLSQWRYIRTYRSMENRTRLYEAAKEAGVPEFPNPG